VIYINVTLPYIYIYIYINSHLQSCLSPSYSTTNISCYLHPWHTCDDSSTSFKKMRKVEQSFIEVSSVFLSDTALICDKSVTTQNLVFLWVIGIQRNVCRCTFNRYSVITQFAKLVAGEQLCRCCTHKKIIALQNLQTFLQKRINFKLWQCCRKWATCVIRVN
jgi:hypothetical protein